MRLGVQNWTMEGYSNMNSGSTGANQPTPAMNEARGRGRIEAWRQLLAQCGRKATRKRVHGMRVLTLRLQAELKHRLSDHELGDRNAQLGQRWGKQAEKLRQVLGPVREADVWLDKLAGLRAKLEKSGGYKPRSSRESAAQIEELEDKLKQKRRTWEKKLIAEIEDRKDKIEKLSNALDLDSEPLIGRCGPGGARQIGEQFTAIAAEFPTLDEKNLHLFRKNIKAVRYLAEIFAAGDLEAGRQAAQLKKMQSAIGEWHDWQDLAKEQRHSHKKHKELAELLEALTAESLEKALELCERVKAQLLKKQFLKGSNAVDSSQVAVGKRPVRSAASTTTSTDEMLA